MKKIVIHIGYSKTGTSSLQRICFNCASDLARYGILYPVTGRFGIAHHFLAKSIVGEKSDEWCPATDMLIWEKFDEEVGASPLNTVFISSELFYQVEDVQKLHDVVSKHGNVQIVVCLREQTEWAESCFTQLYKFDMTMPSMQEWINLEWTRAKMDYESFLKRWESVVGEGNIHVIPYYSRGKKQRDMFTRFLRILGVENEDMCEKMTTLRVNETVQPECIEFMHRLCKLHEPQLFNRLQNLCTIYTSKQSNRKLKYRRLSKTDTVLLQERYKPGNANIAAKYLNGQSLFPDVPPSGDSYEMFPDDLSKELVELERWLFKTLFFRLDKAAQARQKIDGGRKEDKELTNTRVSKLLGCIWNKFINSCFSAK